MIDVCICTHNPRPEVLKLVLRALADQTVPAGTFGVLLVDSASIPALPEETLAPLRAAGIATRMVRESRAGVARARYRAVSETLGQWILFVDDDNELDASYVEEGLRFLREHPDVGCLGGKLRLGPSLQPPPWAVPFLPYLAIKDVGDGVIKGISEDWGEWEPPTAGAFVRRDVAEAYRKRVAAEPRVLDLGRRGGDGLASCEDSLMMRQALGLGLLNAYDPRLALNHHIGAGRFRLSYLLRLMYAYGSSHAALDELVKGRAEVPRHYRTLRAFWKVLWHQIKRRRKTSWAFAIAMVAYHWSARSAYVKAARQGT
ncbi:MAG TPA: glycosyltransferase [Anaeromyxobacter sp.]